MTAVETVNPGKWRAVNFGQRGFHRWTPLPVRVLPNGCQIKRLSVGRKSGPPGLGIDDHPSTSRFYFGESVGNRILCRQGAKRGSSVLRAVHRSMPGAESVVSQDSFDRPASIETGAMTGKQEILQFARLIQRNSSLFRRGSKHSILDTKNQRDLLLEVARRHAAFWQKPIDCLRVCGCRPAGDLMQREYRNCARGYDARSYSLPHSSDKWSRSWVCQRTTQPKRANGLK